MVGARNNFEFPALEQVGFDDGTYSRFLYNTAGQISRISNYASDSHPWNEHLLNYTVYDYTSPSDDCPRLSATRVSAENWTGINGVPSEVVTQYGVEGSGHTSNVVGDPNSVVYKEFYGTSWQRGLTTQTEVWAAGVKQKWTSSTWTQDNTGVNYQTNPRVTESNIYDGTNHKRTTTSYASFTLPGGASCSLPSDVREYAADATAILRRSHSEYRMDATADAAYLDRHIIGLARERSLYEVGSEGETLMSKVGYEYDETGSIQGTDAPVRHDNDNYSATFRIGRANLSSVKRYDINDSSQFSLSSLQYNTTGGVVKSIDPLQHQNLLSYADSFSDGVNSRNTLAYPTTATDADNFFTTIQYNFDFGARTRVQGPPPQNQPQGLIQTFTYDNAARVDRMTTLNNGAYKRYVYGPNYIESFTTVNNVADEAFANTVFDGLGRTTLSVGNNPGSVGGYSVRHTIYDLLGQAVKQSNPTETNGWFTASGDDAAGWLYTQQTYDWKGRPLVTTNQDGTTKEASYGGCGCAGGEIVTLTDEGTLDAGVAKRRQQKIYFDILGRQVKTEVLNWQGGSVYATTVNTYNARDQIKVVRQYQGDQLSGVYQDTTMSYDGYGRLKTKHVPEQQADPNLSGSTDHTTWDYNVDDTVHSVTDARGAIATYSYNNRHLVIGIAYPPLAGIPTTPNVSFDYDAAGNRTLMNDGLGGTTYVYDQLSRLTSETRTFTNVGAFPLIYSYNLANQLTSINDQVFTTTMGYAYDFAGRLNGLTSTGYPNVSQFASNIQYRAWGAVKSVNYGNGKSLSSDYNSRLLPATFSVPGVISKTYQYYADGRMNYSQDVNDPRYDRKTVYDQSAYLTKALSGAEARGLPATEDRPYNQSYQQDVWGNLTNRTDQQWAREPASEPATYTKNRRTDWHYDAEGNWLDDGTYNALQRKYDLAGQLVRIEHPAFPNSPKRTDDYDADGERLRSGYHQSGCSPEFSCPFEYTYYLRSSALGGQIISEVRSNGQKAMGYIYYPNGNVMAVQKLATPTDAATYLLWRHTDPSNASVRASDSNGWTFGEYPNRYNAELDPLGADNGLEDPGPLTLATRPDDFGTGWLVPSTSGGKCKSDGIPIDCNWAMQMLASGAGVQCPHNDCGPQVRDLYNAEGKHVGSILTNPFQAFGDGFSGYLPLGVSYAGNGFILGSMWTGGASEKIGFELGSLAQGLAAYFAGRNVDKKKQRRSQPKPKPTTPVLIDEGSRSNLPTLLPGFHPGEEGRVLETLNRIKANTNCTAAFAKYGLQNIAGLILNGVVIGRADLLQNPDNWQMVGVTDQAARTYVHEGAVGSSDVQAFTIRDWPNYSRNTRDFDNRPRIFLNGSAFNGGTYSLQEVLVHEFLHVAGWPADEGLLRHFRSTDLSYHKGYKEIMEACK